MTNTAKVVKEIKKLLKQLEALKKKEKALKKEVLKKLPRLTSRMPGRRYQAAYRKIANAINRFWP